MTGPRTPQGKKRSSHNALKHGIFSKVAVLKGESRAEFDSLLKGLQESMQPEGTLERLLVEKLASLSWRYRRVVIAERAEIQKAVDFFEWDRDGDRERSLESGLALAPHAGGLMRHLSTPEMIERCLDLLYELRGKVERRGFNLEADREILATLYGIPQQNHLRKTLLDTYMTWLILSKEDASQTSSEESSGKIHFTPEACKLNFLDKVDSEVRWLKRYKKTHDAVDADRTKLELLSRRIPDASSMDRFLKYEASLERNFDRTLAQLERLQRMRLGQPVPPSLRVELATS